MLKKEAKKRPSKEISAAGGLLNNPDSNAEKLKFGGQHSATRISFERTVVEILESWD
jgi:hypothetical protein